MTVRKERVPPRAPSLLVGNQTFSRARARGVTAGGTELELNVHQAAVGVLQNILRKVFMPRSLDYIETW